MNRTIYEGRTSLAKYWPMVGIGTLLLASGIQLVQSPAAREGGYFFAFCGLASLGIAFLNVRATQFTITSQRVTLQKGVFSPRTAEVGVAEIRDVQVSQTPNERLLGIGDVKISVSSIPGTELVFTGIREPHEVAKKIPGRRKKKSAPREGGLRLVTKP